jgi:hypothetical protein
LEKRYVQKNKEIDAQKSQEYNKIKKIEVNYN